MRAVTYLRFSHDKQAKSFSIEEQQEACIQKANFDKTEIVKHFIDRAQSAKTTNRPALIEMLTYVCTKKNDIDALYVYDISRLSRNQIDFSIIKKKLAQNGILIKSVNGVPNDSLEGDMVQDLLARIYQYDNEIKSVKTKGGMYNRFLAGYALHTVRGYKWGVNELGKKTIIPDDSFNDYQKLWFKIRDEKLSILNAVNWFNKCSKTSKLTKSALSGMLNNKVYYGVLSYPKYDEEVKGLHKPMIDEDTFWQVRAIITGRAKNNKIRTKNNPLYPLTKILICPSCEGKVTAAKSKGKKKYYEYYFCKNRKSCKYNVQVDDVHKSFIKLLSNVRMTKEMSQYVKEMILEKYRAHFNDLQFSSTTVEKEIRELTERANKLMDKLLDGTISDDEYKAYKNRIDAELIAKQTLLAEKQMEKIDIETVLEFVFYYMENLHKLWVRFPIEAKIALQCSTFPKGVYFENETCRTPQISDALRLTHKLSDPNGSYVEHLDNIIPAYTQLYQTMRRFVVIQP